jgi:hypothetical protein
METLITTVLKSTNTPYSDGSNKRVIMGDNKNWTAITPALQPEVTVALRTKDPS